MHMPQDMHRLASSSASGSASPSWISVSADALGRRHVLALVALGRLVPVELHALRPDAAASKRAARSVCPESTRRWPRRRTGLGRWRWSPGPIPRRRRRRTRLPFREPARLRSGSTGLRCAPRRGRRVRGSWLMAAMIVVASSSNSEPGRGTGRGRPEASGGPRSMRMQRTPTATPSFWQNLHRRGQDIGSRRPLRARRRSRA